MKPTALTAFQVGHAAPAEFVATVRVLPERERRVLLDLGFAAVGELGADALIRERGEWEQ